MITQILATSFRYSTTYEPEAIGAGIGAGVGVLFGILAVMMIPIIIVGIVSIIAMWKIFEKAGRPGWNAIVPIYNMYVLTEISGQNGLLFLLCLIPGVGAVIWNILVALKLAPAFGKDTSFAIGIIFLPVIFYGILGFGKSQYLLDNATGTTTAQSPFNTQPNTGATPTQPTQPVQPVQPAQPETPTNTTANTNPFQTPPTQA